MNFHSLHHTSQLFVKSFESASLINADSKLLASHDSGQMVSTTSRLVVFHIVKKYLPPNVGDLIIVNDPENGGLDFKHIFFVSRVTDQLYMVFVKVTPHIDFKIPPTPIFEKGSRNKLIWSLLVEPNSHSTELAAFFDHALHKVSSIQNLKKELTLLGDTKNQAFLFNVIQQIFEKKFNNQALGFVETVFKLNLQEQIKMKLSIDEKLNQRTILMDFSQTSVAGETSAASHVIESVLIHKLASFYQMTSLISQPFLDQIRMSLPPKSIVSKATPKGTKNLYMQKIISENLNFLCENLSSKNSKKKPVLEIAPETLLNISIDEKSYPVQADSKKFNFHGLDQLVQSKKLIPLELNFLDNKVHMKFKIGAVQKVVVNTTLKLGDVAENFLVFKGQPVKKTEPITAAEGDEFELNWKLK